MSHRTQWFLNPEYQSQTAFSGLSNVFALTGEAVTNDELSNVIRFENNKQIFYVKRYTRAGKGLRRWLGRSRIQGEWENLLYFQQLNIPTPPIVAYGAEYRYGVFQRGALITAEIPNSHDLASYAKKATSHFHNKTWRHDILNRVAEYTRQLHASHFGHQDLKWRNILVTDEASPTLYFIDCPLGRRVPFWRWPHAQRKDLYCLYKLGKVHLSATECLRFYLRYCGQQKLRPEDKSTVRAVCAQDR